jgi:dTDP-4-dehydrorhamnose 3,5-epimerase
VKITPAPLAGAFVIDVEPRSDERGFFARSFCAREMGALGINTQICQENISFNARAGTLRGMHFQRDPHGETKIVRCTQGAIFDVILDLRRESPMFCRWAGFELSSANHRAVYVPLGCAHGFLTLTPNSEVLYQMGQYYVPDAAAGVRYDDPAFAIQWPGVPEVISERDLAYSPFVAE